MTAPRVLVVFAVGVACGYLDPPLWLVALAAFGSAVALFHEVRRTHHGDRH